MTVVASPHVEHVQLPFPGVQTRSDLVAGVELHPAVASWFEDRFTDGPTAPPT
ncbi:MAG: hypothetical protein M5U19_22115 [Microthrixaceae bacterium]|nr:hypothetical protein [Microthrixaceae bacterium]